MFNPKEFLNRYQTTASIWGEEEEEEFNPHTFLQQFPTTESIYDSTPASTPKRRVDPGAPTSLELDSSGAPKTTLDYLLPAIGETAIRRFKGIGGGYAGFVEGIGQGLQWAAAEAENFSDKYPRLKKAQEWARENIPGASFVADLPKETGKAIADWGELMAETYEIEDPTILDNLMNAYGSGLSFLVPGLVAGKATQALSKAKQLKSLAEWTGIGVTSFLAAGSEAGRMYDQELEITKDNQTALNNARKSFFVNLAIMAGTNKLGGLFKEGGAGWKQVLRAGFAEFLEEGAQTYTEVAVPGREDPFAPGRIPQYLEAGAYGAVVGGTFGAARAVDTSMAGRARQIGSEAPVQGAYKGRLMDREGARQFAFAYPMDAKNLASKEVPSRKDMKDITGSTEQWSSQERKQFADWMREFTTVEDVTVEQEPVTKEVSDEVREGVQDEQVWEGTLDEGQVRDEQRPGGEETEPGRVLQEEGTEVAPALKTEGESGKVEVEGEVQPVGIDEIDNISDGRDRDIKFMKKGQYHAPGLRLSEQITAGRLAYVIEKGDATLADWNTWIEEAKREKRFNNKDAPIRLPIAKAEAKTETPVKSEKLKRPELRLTGDKVAGPTAEDQKFSAGLGSRIAILRGLNEKTRAYPGENFDLIDPAQIDQVRDYMIDLQKSGKEVEPATPEKVIADIKTKSEESFTESTKTVEKEIEQDVREGRRSTIYGTNFEPRMVQVENVTLSKDVPQFKGDGDPVTGETEPLKGAYDPFNTPPVIVWERRNGKLEVITGRHRLALARRSGQKEIESHVVKESEGFTKEMAIILDAESNIRDGQGKVSDYANYFKHTETTYEEASSRGLLARDKGRTGFLIGKFASEDLYATYRAGKISEAKTAAIAEAAPNDNNLQSIGLKEAKGKNAEELGNYLKAVRAMMKADGSEKVDQLDMFQDESFQERMNKMASAATSIQNKLQDERRALRSAKGISKGKKADILKQYGFEPGDIDAVDSRLSELDSLIERWSNWSQHPDLVRQVESEAGIESRTTIDEDVEVEPEQQVEDENQVTLSFSRSPGSKKATLSKSAMRSARPDPTTKPPKDTGEIDEDGDIGKADAIKLTEALDAEIEVGTLSGLVVDRLKMPELVSLAEEMIGKYPDVKTLRRSLGLASTVEGRPDLSKILLNPENAKNPFLIARILAHEIGHITDFSSQYTMKRGNILGRIAGLRNYFMATLKEHPDADFGPITKEERIKLRKRAEQMVRSDGYKKKKDGVEYNKAVSRRYKKLLNGVIMDRRLHENKPIREELMALTEWWNPYDKTKADKEYQDYRNSAVELYADAFSVFLVSPGHLKQRAPLFWKALMNHIEGKQQFLDKYIDLQNLIAGDPKELYESRRDMLHMMFTDDYEAQILANKQAIDIGKLSPMESFKNRFYQALFDKHAPIWLRTSKVTPETMKWAPGENWRGDLTYKLDELYYKDNENHIFLDKVSEDVYKKLTDAGIDDNIIGEYLVYRRILNERGEMMNPSGFDPETSKEQLAHLKKSLGEEKFKLLKDQMQKFNDLVYNITEKAVEAGVYSKQVFEEKIKPNKDSYAAFAVIKYITGDDLRVPAGISQQIGTFQKIANPFHATLSKMMALNRLIQVTEAKTAFVKEWKKSFPQEITKAESDYHTKRPKVKAKEGFQHLYHLEDGKVVYYEIPQMLYDAFASGQNKNSMTRAAEFMGSAIYKVFHPLFVTFSIDFQGANFFRDLRRTHENLGTIGTIQRTLLEKQLIADGMSKAQARKQASKQNITLGQVFAAYLKAFPSGIRRARGIKDADVDALMKSKALGTPFIQLDQDMDAKYLEKELIKHGLKRAPQKDRGPGWKAVAKLLSSIEALNIAHETTMKQAGWKLLEARGVPESERAMLVRNYVSTPNFKTKGTWTPVTNSIFMYQNVNFQGKRFDFHLATDPTTRSAWWTRHLIWSIMPVTFWKAALYGLMGAYWKELYEKIPTYFLESYDVVPLGFDNTGENDERKAVFLTIPKNETGRLVSRIASKMFDFALETAGVDGPKLPGLEKTVRKGLLGVLHDEIFPTMNPLLNMASKWKDYATGQNPVDDFMERNLLTDKEQSAGGWYAGRKMMAWSLDRNFGQVSSLIRPVTRNVLGQPYDDTDATTMEITFSSIPGLNRMLRVSDRGVREDDIIQMEVEDAERARFNLDLDKYTRRLTRERYALMRKGDRITPKEKAQYEILNAWYNTNYLPVTKEMFAAREVKEKQAENGLWTALEDVSQRTRLFKNLEAPQEIRDTIANKYAKVLARQRPNKLSDDDRKAGKTLQELRTRWEDNRKEALEVLNTLKFSRGEIQKAYWDKSLKPLKNRSVMDKNRSILNITLNKEGFE